MNAEQHHPASTLPIDSPTARIQRALPARSRRSCSVSCDGGCPSPTCAICRRAASPRSTQADRRNRKRRWRSGSPVGRPRAPRRAAPCRRGSPPEFHARRPRPAASGGRRIDRRRHRTGGGVRRLCARTRATAPGRREPRTAAARPGAAPPRSAAARPARGVLDLWLDQLGVAHPAHIVHSHRHSPPRSRGALLRPGGVLVIASIPEWRGGRSADRRTISVVALVRRDGSAPSGVRRVP